MIEGQAGIDPGQLEDAEWDSKLDGYAGVWRDDLAYPSPGFLRAHGCHEAAYASGDEGWV